MKKPLVRMINIKKRFGDFYLENINMELYRGEVHILVGENGAGKSTLMKLLGGWFPPESGTIEMEGRPVRFKSINDAMSYGIVYMNQDVQSFDNLTVGENVFFGFNDLAGKTPFLFNKYKVWSECSRLFSKLGISIDPSIMFKRLGYAERQLIAAVRAYISNADVIIFDEPSSAMSEPERNTLFSIVGKLKKQEKAIFYISHRMDEIGYVGDRISVLHKGKITESRTCDEIDHDLLVRMMTGDVHKQRYPRIEKPAGPILLSVRDIELKPILKNVNFDLYKSEILGITGLMGSGRTLLANIMFGAVKAKRGSISINGKIISLADPQEAMSAGLSLIPENRIDNGIFSKHNLLTNMTSATLRRFEQKGILDDYIMQDLTQSYVREMGIDPGQNEDMINHYSGGNQQKVLIARWLMNRSKVYIMDEPTRSIDAASKVDIYNAMNDLVNKGASIILISSEIEEILGMSDRILVLAGGRIACEFSRAEATKEKILEYAMLEE